jgi:hypothetical protein
VLREAPQGPVLVTWANLHYLDFVLNWVAHVRALGVRAYLVGAMDDAILQVAPAALQDPAPALLSCAACACMAALP